MKISNILFNVGPNDKDQTLLFPSSLAYSTQTNAQKTLSSATTGSTDTPEQQSFQCQKEGNPKLIAGSCV
jgi:hypothetical protein